MVQVSSGVLPKSFLRGDSGLDSKCSRKKGCKSACVSERAAQVRGKVFLGRDEGSTSVFKSLATRQRLLRLAGASRREGSCRPKPPSLIFRVHSGAVAVSQPWMEAAVFKICFEKRSASSAAAGPSVLHR